jgi:hypothetical protein
MDHELVVPVDVCNKEVTYQEAYVDEAAFDLSYDIAH